MSALASLQSVAALLSQRGLKVPPALRRGIATAAAAPAAVQPRLAAAIAVQLPALASLAPYEGPLCPSYPRAEPKIAARLALGEQPARVLRGLTPREAHEALTAGVSDPATWVLRDIPAHGVRAVAVARWVAACWADPERRAALESERTERVAGVEVRGRLLNRIDEITPADLARGAATGVQPAFAAAAARLYAQWEKGAEHDDRPLASIPRWWRPVRCAHALMSAKSLCAEGRAMRHCVGTYAPHVQSERSIIVSLAVRVRGELFRSTVELDRRSREVRQHRGVENAAPPEVCKRALEVCMRRWAR